jgi:hypothetical protein
MLHAHQAVFTLPANKPRACCIQLKLLQTTKTEPHLCLGLPCRLCRPFALCFAATVAVICVFQRQLLHLPPSDGDGRLLRGRRVGRGGRGGGGGGGGGGDVGGWDSVPSHVTHHTSHDTCHKQFVTLYQRFAMNLGQVLEYTQVKTGSQFDIRRQGKGSNATHLHSLQFGVWEEGGGGQYG